MRRTDDYDYTLPHPQIAQVPADRRDASRLMVVGADDPHRAFAALPELVPDDAVVVVNDTRVIPARLLGRKSTGGAIELLLVEPAAGGWLCMARASKPVRRGTEIELSDGTRAQVLAAADGLVQVQFERDALDVARDIGSVPLPPYIERDTGPTEADRERYQTVYAREPGAVAAPTAGLHFTEDILSRLDLHRLTLHVGPGTFAPVRSESIDEHRMHAERFDVPVSTFDATRSGRPVVAVGTTVVRALESATGPGPGRTDLFITPGYRFERVDLLVTNFHLPRSTLLMMVCAFAGYDRVMAAYRDAVAADYRFYSYGDAMLLERAP